MRTKIARLFIVLCLGWMVACDSNTNGPFKPVSEEPALIDRRVSTPEELARLELHTPNKDDQVHLKLILETVAEGLEENDYIFLFDHTVAASDKPLILDRDGVPLIAIMRLVREEPTCTTWVTVALKDGETTEGYGGRIRAATRGICGGIAAMHSMLLLGLVDQREVIEGEHFKEGPLRRLQGQNRTQMTERRLRELHEAAGATTCQTQGGNGFPTNNRNGLERFNRELREKMNDPNHTWDCTVFFRTKRNGKWVLAHFEHVESVKGTDASTTITTTNGLNQGNQRDTVPVSPGSNTWSSNPGRNPPFELTGSTHSDAEKYKAGIPPVGMVKYLCCRR